MTEICFWCKMEDMPHTAYAGRFNLCLALKGMVNISRKGKMYAPVAAFLGVVGAVLRIVELKTVFEPETGLAMRGQPITVSLILLSAVSVTVFIILSLGLKKMESPATYSGALESKSSLALIASALAALGLAIGSVLYFVGGTRGPAELILMLCGLLAAVSAFLLSRNVFFQRDNSGNAIFSTIIVIFVCLWMVLEYKLRSADPVILHYVYDFLALCSAAVALYYKAGFAFDRLRPSRTILFSMIACYFCLVATPGGSGSAQKIYFFCIALLLIADMPAIIGNLKEK